MPTGCLIGPSWCGASTFPKRTENSDRSASRRPVALPYGGRHRCIQVAKQARGQAPELHVGCVQARLHTARCRPSPPHNAAQRATGTGVGMTSTLARERVQPRNRMRNVARHIRLEKTGRPGLWRGLRVTGVPTPEELIPYQTLMCKAEKTLNLVLRGTSDTNIPFKDLCSLLLKLGFSERVRGDHFIYSKEGVEEMSSPFVPRRKLIK